MKNKLTITLSINQRRVLALVNIMEEIISIINTMEHPEYNVLMRDTDMEELKRLAKQGRKLTKELQK
tara:strand:+ start:128 stop:328 length:201 start_codon:yes stop_codon:yes gene_type:complete